MQFQHLWFRYGRRAEWALREVDATIAPGSTVVVLGRNGAGKSTLLQLAAGVLRPTRGDVHERPAVVGWVPERFPTDQPFTTHQYLSGMAAVRGLSSARAAREINRWLERLGLTAHRHTPLSALSKGTAQKVGLVQALLVPPGLLVLDEPWEGLDAQARSLVPELVAEVTNTGGAVLVSDHRGEIATLPDAVRWTVADATLTTDEPPAADHTDAVVVEVAVHRAAAPRTMAQLRADGHRILSVREPDSLIRAAELPIRESE
ncbi:ATP-binding cassette domain-containing protein, partial [Actinoplanes sp. NPDC051859]|uniref:ATP-binding cassette domain-containing protein n=1 Tax=Actinoplanes sp. NPDC051859 TaxID=3363909 RepID=UPI0037A2C2C4